MNGKKIVLIAAVTLASLVLGYALLGLEPPGAAATGAPDLSSASPDRAGLMALDTVRATAWSNLRRQDEDGEHEYEHEYEHDHEDRDD